MNEFHLSKKALKALKDKEFIRTELASGKSAQELLGFKDSTMSKFYHAAYRLFDGKRYEDAADAFLFLVSLNAYRAEYWIGLGMCLQMLGTYETAVDAYEMAAVVEVDNPIPYFYLAKCLFAIHDRESAFQALNLAIEFSGDNPRYEEMKAQAIEAKRLLENF